MIKNSKYSIGLDIGTGSVGHVALDDSYNLMKYKGRYAWGSRLFDNAETAATTRMKRGARRGYRRRNNRIALLQEVMEPTLVEFPNFLRVKNELEKVWSSKNDFENRSLSEVLFEIGGNEYYKKYPTIYHLRQELFETKDKVDPRLVYLAIHNLTKFRGHFLYDSLDPSQGAANEDESKEQLQQFIYQSFELIHEDVIDYDIDEVWNIISDTKMKKVLRLEQLSGLFGKKFTGVFFKLLLGGYKVKLQNIFEDFEDKTMTIDLSHEESDDIISQFADDQESFLQIAKTINNGIILKNLLLGSRTIAEAKVKKYDHFHKQLQDVKDILYKHDKDVYKEVFVSTKKAIQNYERHHDMDQLCLFDKFRYQKKESIGAKDALYKKIKTVFESMTETPQIVHYLEEIEEGTLFERLNGVENRAIPMQCSSYEATVILKNQNIDNSIIEKVKALIEFRIPYYVGPLVKVNKNERFNWAVRKTGMEHERVTPWNFDQVIDKDKSGVEFINRMRNMCTYLYKEETLPKYSLLYQEYEVLNELNGVSWMVGARKTAESKFTAEEKHWIIENVFKKTKTVTVKKLKDELQRSDFYYERSGKDRNIVGTQKETSFASSLSSWIDFTAIFGEINQKNYNMIEEIILWLTLFTEKDIIERSIQNAYPHITEKQVNSILKLTSKYKGYGRLSKMLLNGIVDTTDYHKTIIEHMREKPDVFMRILNDATYGYKETIEKENHEESSKKSNFSYKIDVEPLPGSPAVKRSIWQSLKIVDEYVRLFGKPERIVIEMPREEDIRNKNKRTKSREDQWEEIKKDLKGSELLNNVLGEKKLNFKDDRVWLYLHQNAKCMYSGETLDINKLEDYDIDHILPQRFIKDDSLDNKVLVLNKYNGLKSGDKLPLDVANANMIPIWKSMHDKNLISAKKFNNLMRRKLTDEDKIGFIARQLVETRQITKHVVRILENHFTNEDGQPTVVISALKPDIVLKLKKDMGIIKIREAGDKHHAIDAFMCAWLDRFMDEQYGKNIFQFEFDSQLSDKQKWILANTLSDKNESDKMFFLFRDTKAWKYINHKTGEFISNAIPYFKKIVYDTPCQFTSRFVGAPARFSGETIFSSKVGLNGKLSGTPFLNSGKSNKGLYSNLEVAYMCIISYEKIIGEKITPKTELVNVQVIENAVYKNDKNNFAIYLCNQQLSDKERVRGVRVENCQIIRKIEKGQLLRSNGNHLFTIKSVKEMNNAVHLRMTENELHLCAKMLENKEITVDKSDVIVYNGLKDKILFHYAEIMPAKLVALVQQSELNQENILSLLRITRVGAANGKMFGSDRPTRYTKSPKLDDTVLIHQSITGLEVREEHLLKGE
ncbi:MAG: type II CRISPR RNA-guided endonuclease Cas9 [Culicoidibacterales bacterium]